MELNRDLFPNLFVFRNCTLPSPEWWIPIIPSTVIFLAGLFVILSLRGISVLFSCFGKRLSSKSQINSSKPLSYLTHDVHGLHIKSGNNSYQHNNFNKPDAFHLRQYNIDSNKGRSLENEQPESGKALELEPLDSASNPLFGSDRHERHGQQKESEQGVMVERLVLEHNRQSYLFALERFSQRIHYAAVDMLFARTRSGTILLTLHFFFGFGVIILYIFETSDTYVMEYIANSFLKGFTRLILSCILAVSPYVDRFHLQRLLFNSLPHPGMFSQPDYAHHHCRRPDRSRYLRSRGVSHQKSRNYEN